MATTSKSSTKSSSTKSTSAKSATTKSAPSKSTSSKSTYKPGEEASKDLRLFVKDSKGKTLGEINVPAGHRVPPTRSKKASTYEMKK